MTTKPWEPTDDEIGRACNEHNASPGSALNAVASDMERMRASLIAGAAPAIEQRDREIERLKRDRDIANKEVAYLTERVVVLDAERRAELAMRHQEAQLARTALAALTAERDALGAENAKLRTVVEAAKLGSVT
jgi:hypothetical protein